MKHQTGMSAFVQRNFLKLIIPVVGLYLLVGTIIWQMATMLLIAAIVPLTHTGLPEAQKIDTTEYVIHQPTLKAICDFSNWVAGYTQPLVSDDRLIAYWQTHRDVWERAIASGEYGSSWKKLEAIGLEEYSPTLNETLGDSAITVRPTDSAGPQTALRVCVPGKGMVSNVYVYYPNIEPVIHDGRVMSPSEVSRYQPNVPGGMRGALLVETTDHVNYEDHTMRRIDAHWYIRQ